MSYQTDMLDGLRVALKNTDGLKMELKKFNSNVEVFERLAKAIEKQNELKERELQVLEKEQKIREMTLGKRNCL